jgi:hypothetical protein
MHDVVHISKHDHLRGRRVEHPMALDAERISRRLNWRCWACVAADAPAERLLEKDAMTFDPE